VCIASQELNPPALAVAQIADVGDSALLSKQCASHLTYHSHRARSELSDRFQRFRVFQLSLQSVYSFAELVFSTVFSRSCVSPL
jgi:predicted ATPase